MKEGWFGENYWIFFDDNEVSAINLKYGLEKYLENFTIVGLRGWDDFILRDKNGDYFTIPTVPLDRQYLKGIAFPCKFNELENDERVRGKIKWYIKPIVFGGDPNIGSNTVWLVLTDHADLVKWWNEFYYRLQSEPQA